MSAHLLCADKIPMQQTRLKAANAAVPVLWHCLDEPHPQDAKSPVEIPLILEVADGPLEQIDPVDILDDGALLDVLLKGDESRRLLGGRVELALCAYFHDLGGVSWAASNEHGSVSRGTS